MSQSDQKQKKEELLHWIEDIILNFQSRGCLSAAEVEMLNKAHAFKTEIIVELSAKNYKINWPGLVQMLNLGFNVVEWFIKRDS